MASSLVRTSVFIASTLIKSFCVFFSSLSLRFFASLEVVSKQVVVT